MAALRDANHVQNPVPVRQMPGPAALIRPSAGAAARPILTRGSRRAGRPHRRSPFLRRLRPRPADLGRLSGRTEGAESGRAAGTGRPGPRRADGPHSADPSGKRCWVCQVCAGQPGRDGKQVRRGSIRGPFQTKLTPLCNRLQMTVKARLHDSPDAAGRPAGDLIAARRSGGQSRPILRTAAGRRRRWRGRDARRRGMAGRTRAHGWGAERVRQRGRWRGREARCEARCPQVAGQEYALARPARWRSDRACRAGRARGAPGTAKAAAFVAAAFGACSAG